MTISCHGIAGLAAAASNSATRPTSITIEGGAIPDSDANRNTASETVRTLLVYGYVLDPPSADAQEEAAGGEEEEAMHVRTYRLEKTYAVSAGKW